MIYANAVSGSFHAAHYTNLFQGFNYADLYQAWVPDFVGAQNSQLDTVNWALITASTNHPAAYTLYETNTSFSSTLASLTNASLASIYVPTLAKEWAYQPMLAAQRFEDAKAARATINEFATLQENWDGYDASPISEQVRNHALRFIDTIEAFPTGMPIPEVSPTASGTIAFEWENQDSQAYLEIGNTRYSGYTRADKQTPTFIQGLADYLDQRVITTIQRDICTPSLPSPPVTEIHIRALRHELLAA